MVGPYHPKAREPSLLLWEKKKSVGRKNGLGPLPEWSYRGRLGALTVTFLAAVLWRHPTPGLARRFLTLYRGTDQSRPDPGRDPSP
jgi:hypothetical protein